jgi:hypothetical protein
MLALLDNGQDLDTCEAEIGGPVGQLLTPLTSYRLRDPLRPWALDNGGFKAPDPDGLLRLMRREEQNRATCLFVACPDIVGSAQRTLEVFKVFRPKLAGWPVALVCQDGQEHLPIPWDEINAVFIGGSTNWKCSGHVVQIIKTAKLLGKWVHAGRVNDPNRWRHFEEAGADSGDGSGAALVLRDAIHEAGGAKAAMVAIAIGGALSWLYAPGALVVASVAAFVLAELADLAVYAPLRRRQLGLAVLASGLAGAGIDSAVFLWLAFGSLDFIAGQILGKAWMSLAALPLIALLRRQEAPHVGS